MRIGSIVKIEEEHLDEYKSLHASVWTSVLKMIQECNIRNYSIFYKDGLLFSYYEYIGDNYQRDMAKMALDPETQKWWSVVKPLQQPLNTIRDGEWWTDMEEVFHCD